MSTQHATSTQLYTAVYRSALDREVLLAAEFRMRTATANASRASGSSPGDADSGSVVA